MINPIVEVNAEKRGRSYSRLSLIEFLTNLNKNHLVFYKRDFDRSIRVLQ